MFSISRIKAVGPDDDDDDDDDELFLWYGWLTKGLISSRDYCRRSSPSQISDMPQAGFGPAWNLSSGFDEWSCAVVITTTSLRHKITLSFSYQCKRS